MKTITKQDIVFALKLGGIKEGDIVLMHSALSSIGRVEGGADTVIDAVLEAVGESGTFAVSTMAFNHPYDPENDRSTVGIISETHRLRKNSIRSLRPVHCINAIGAKAYLYSSNLSTWYLEWGNEICGSHDPGMKRQHYYMNRLGVDERNVYTSCYGTLALPLPLEIK